MKKVFITMVILLVCALIIGCAAPKPAPAPTPTPAAKPAPAPKPAAAPTPRYGGTLKIITTRALPAFDAPVEATGPIIAVAIHAIWNTLITYDKLGNATPGLAEATEISPDGKTMTFRLRKGVKFHDGTDFIAAAVKYHIENFKYARQRWENIASMDILDPYTIRLNLSKPDHTLIPNFGGAMYGAITSPTAVQKPPTAPENKHKEHVVGTGPFKFVEWKRDVHLKTVKFADYWDKGKPYLDGLDVIFMKDPVSSVLAFQAGEAQVIRDLSPRDAADLKAKGYNVQYCEANTYVLCPDSKPGSPFTNKRVREAVEYAIDKQAIVKAFGFGFIEPQYQSATSSRPLAYVPGLLERKYDVAKAKQLLAEAGYPSGFDTTIFAQTSDDKEILTAIQTYLSAAGIRAKLDLSEAAKFMEQGSKGWTNGLRYYYPGVDINPIVTYNTFYGPLTMHFMAMDKPKSMLDAIAQAMNEPNPTKVKELAQSVTKTLHGEVLVVPLWTWSGIAAMQKSVHNLDLFNIDQFRWSAADTWLGE